MASLVEIEDEIGNVDLCECEDAPSTRVLRIVRRVKFADVVDNSEGADRVYQAQYAYACGYHD